MRAVAMMQVIDVKLAHFNVRLGRYLTEDESYSPREWEYQRIARETGVPAREVYTMFVSPGSLGVPA